MADFNRHPRWDDIRWVVGQVDAYGAVHAQIVFKETESVTHNALFPNAPKYKTWRWTKMNGVTNAMGCEVYTEDEDEVAIYEWLFKHGCLNKWEVKE